MDDIAHLSPTHASTHAAKNDDPTSDALPGWTTSSVPTPILRGVTNSDRRKLLQFYAIHFYSNLPRTQDQQCDRHEVAATAAAAAELWIGAANTLKCCHGSASSI